MLTSGQPVGGARVMISGPGLPVGRTAITDNAGRFSITGLPAGRFFLNASKQGYVNVSFGQRRPGGMGTPVQLGDGEQRDVAIRLPRGGVITGMVLDERGDPAINVNVRLLRFMAMNGQRRLQSANSGMTDDRGIYRVHSLQPGDYAVCATARDMGPQSDAQRVRAEMEGLQRMMSNASGPNAETMRRQMAVRLAQLQQAQLADSEPTPGYAPVCYPGNAATPAGLITVGAGEERAGIDFQLHLTTVARVEGAIVAPAGVDLQHVQITMAHPDEAMGDLNRQGTSAQPDGVFRFSNVPPGRYRIVARSMTQGRPMMVNRPGGQGSAPPTPNEARLWAAAEIVVAGQDLSDVILELQRGSSFSGQIVLQGSQAQAQPPDPGRAQVSLVPFATSYGGIELATPAQGRVDAGGRFTIPDVLPGRYRLSASVPGGGPWFLTSAMIEDQESADFPIEIRPGHNVTSAVLTLSDRDTELSGTLTNQKGEPAFGYTLVLYATDERFWFPMSRRVRVSAVAPDGRFMFRNVPPGDYRLGMAIDPDPGTFYEASFLTDLDANSMRVALAEGERRIEHLRVK